MTISYNRLCDRGRLGNLMFQYATLRGIAKKHGYDFMIPPSDFNDEWHDHQLLEVFELEGLKNIDVQNTSTRIEESCFHFDENLFENCPDNVDIFGYFQTEKYFKNAADEVRKDFTFKKDILGPCEEMMGDVGPNAISLHVRRGDYVNLNENLNDIFYKKSLDYCKNNIESFNYEIFTDDYEWVKSNKIFKDANYIHSDNISVENTIKSFGKANVIIHGV